MKFYSVPILLTFFFFQFVLAAPAIDPINEKTVQEYIKETIEKLEDIKTLKLNGEKIPGNSVITALYNDVGYEPLWESSVNRNDLIDILESSYFDGLNPEDYHLSFIKAYIYEIENGKQPISKNRALADITMTNALLTYAFHMIQGKVDPTLLDPHWNYSKEVLPDSPDLKVLNALNTKTLKTEVNKIRPQLKMYSKFRDLFAKYDSIHRVNGDIEQLEYPGKALRLGDSSQTVVELKRHLKHFNTTLDYSDDNVFDEELEEALMAFQKQNKLDADGIAGEKTFELLNMSVQDRMNILRVNMERVRWLNNNWPEEFLLVNIADFNLYIYRNLQVDYNCRVVVGKEHHETPVFTSEIKYIVFNPTWTVPYSIATKETLPKLKTDSQYLKKHNMTLLRNNEVVDPSSIDFNQYSRKNFPFTVRQEPGPDNALGQVKFIFPNDYSVYLHDTPSKSFFEKSERAFSHGCVRVHNPLVLAEQLLKKQDYNKTKIDEIIKTEKLQTVYLDEAMPIAIMYWTCYEDITDGKMYFHRDVYGRDKMVLKMLNEKR
jgi:murein L,D-transpeptidase YcbB/YkuD